MTVAELISFVNSVRPGHAFTDAQLVEWINECEAKIQTDIMLIEPADVIEYDSTIDAETHKMVDADTELLAPHPWDKIYRYFLYMMIDMANGEANRQANSEVQYNEAYHEYAGWYASHIAPANGLAEAHGYYISAYAYAVRGGYTGTLRDFYETLGDIGTISSDTQGYMEQAQEAAQSAAESAEDAAGSVILAEQAAAVGGWMHFEIDDNGELIYTKTSNITEIDFQIDRESGELEVVYG